MLLARMTMIDRAIFCSILYPTPLTITMFIFLKIYHPLYRMCKSIKYENKLQNFGLQSSTEVIWSGSKLHLKFWMLVHSTGIISSGWKWPKFRIFSAHFSASIRKNFRKISRFLNVRSIWPNDPHEMLPFQPFPTGVCRSSLVWFFVPKTGNHGLQPV